MSRYLIAMLCLSACGPAPATRDAPQSTRSTSTSAPRANDDHYRVVAGSTVVLNPLANDIGVVGRGWVGSTRLGSATLLPDGLVRYAAPLQPGTERPIIYSAVTADGVHVWARIYINIVATSQSGLIVSQAAHCISNDHTLADFRQCLTNAALALAGDDPRRGCHFALVDSAAAKAAIDTLKDGHALGWRPLVAGSSCAQKFPGAVFLISATEFSRQREQQFALPVDYPQLRSGLESLLDYLDNYIFGANITATPRENSRACPSVSDEPLVDLSAPASWAFLGYVSVTLRSGMAVVADDPWAPTLSARLRRALLRLADHIVDYANADDFDGLDETGFGPTLGWNNLGSRWDAWGNGTCSSARAPNLWASSWALHVLALAYGETHDPRYRSAFYRGAVYWHADRPSRRFAPGYSDYQRASRTLSQGGAYAIRSAYAVGGSRFSGSSAQQQVIRYHYYSDDPGRYAVNTSASMSLALLTMGHYDSGGFWIAGLDSQPPSYRSLANLGWWGIYSAHGNLAAENFGYEDLESPGFHSRAYDSHLDFVIYYVARAGMQLGNAYYVNQAKRALKTVFARGAKVAIYGVCLVRELDPDFLARCREAIRGKSLNNPWVLFNAASVLNLRGQAGS